ncbi:MAG: sugar phosphate isomerase/epimerase family protein [Mariniblastus sp.]
MILGYNTNGLSNHNMMDGLELLVDTGYKSVALTIDHGWLSPNDAGNDVKIQEVKHFLKAKGISNVIETGARFLLNPRVKHDPTLLNATDEEAERRIDFLKYCIDVAVELESDCVSLWSGIKPPEISYNFAMDRLTKNLAIVLEYAEERQMDIGFEPEPGMLIDNTGRFERLIHLLDSPRLKMTLDIGHLFCLSEIPIATYIEKWADRLVNIHIEDMKAGVHEHLMFGEGQIYFPPVIESLKSIGYDRGVHIELSRHSHNAAEIAKQSYNFLAPIISDVMSDNI